MALDPAPHILLVVAPYYRDITEQLVAGATAELEREGATWERIDVAGAFEIPAAISIVRQAGDAGKQQRRFDGYIALGCVIRGQTSHYDHICNEIARAFQDMAVIHRTAIGFGVLTCENGEQARVRSDVTKKNKGGEAARACLSVIGVQQAFGVDPDRAPDHAGA
jgi:6,7-dimethyl-8-ribityllumazine synthase